MQIIYLNPEINNHTISVILLSNIDIIHELFHKAHTLVLVWRAAAHLAAASRHSIVLLGGVQHLLN